MNRIIFLAPLLLLGACSLLDERDADGQPVMEERVDNALLYHVPENERSDVVEARQAADATRDAYAAACAETERASERRKLAELDLEVAQAELERSETALEMAENGTQEELDRAKQSVVDAKALVASVRARITLRERQVEYAKAVEELRLEKNRLAQAKVEVTKAVAVRELDRPQAKAIELSAFEEQVRHCQEAVDSAQARVDAARAEVVTARGAYDGSVKAVPESLRRDWPAEEDPPKDEKPRD